MFAPAPVTGARRAAAAGSAFIVHPSSFILFVVAVALAAFAAPAPPAAAQLPNRIYGTVTLNGAPAPAGTPILALTGGKTCGSSTVTAPGRNGLTYLLDVPDGGAAAECKPGAIITFTVGGLTAAQSFMLDELGSFHRIDLTAPGTPDVPAAGPGTVALTAGCTDVTSTFPDGTRPEAIAAAVAPASALSGIWRYDAAAGVYLGYSPAASWASDLTTVNRGDTLRLCTTATATLTLPA